eukprot:COSAG01_NODE_46062_length_403_cov_1.875000_1_plen_58_part_10
MYYDRLGDGNTLVVALLLLFNSPSQPPLPGLLLQIRTQPHPSIVGRRSQTSDARDRSA